MFVSSSYQFLQHMQSALPPEQMAWCGLDSVLLYWDDMLLMVGPSEDCVTYIYDEPLVLIPEWDGVRVLSNTSMEFVQRVPDSTVSIFKIGSTSPASLLFDALDHFDRQSAKVRIFFFFKHRQFTSSNSVFVYFSLVKPWVTYSLKMFA